MAKNAASLPEREQVECGIGLALAYDGLGFREKAISSLKTARETCPANSRLALFLAKLYFREDRKADAVAVCLTVVQAAAVPGAESDGQLDPASAAELSDLADAFYIIGWVQIHAGDHSSGYVFLHGVVAINNLILLRTCLYDWRQPCSLLLCTREHVLGCVVRALFLP